jgi:integrase
LKPGGSRVTLQTPDGTFDKEVSMFRRKRNGNWYFHHPVDGTKVSSGTPDKARAQLLYRKLQDEAFDRKTGKYVEEWQDVAKRWMDMNPHLANRESQEAYHAFWMRHLEGLKLPMIDESLVHDVINRHRPISLKEPLPANSTANQYVNFVGKILRFGRVTPPKFHRYPERKQSKGALKPEQWAALRDSLPNELRFVCTFALATGLRIENVTGLHWDWVHGGKAYLPASVTKTDQPYGIPLNQSAFGVVEEAKRQAVRHQTHVFTYRGQPWAYNTLYDAIKRHSKRSVGFEVTPHWFRHTFRSWLAQEGVSDSIARRLGCWQIGSGADSKYLHFDVEPLRRFAEMLDPLISTEERKVAHA